MDGAVFAVARRGRAPRQLLLGLLGDHVLGYDDGPVRTGAFLHVLGAAGVAESATRTCLDRMVRARMLSRRRSGREQLYSLTPEGGALLEEARERVRGDAPFAPVGSGWTLVTFSIPERQRGLRHRLRATLAWEGFAPLRDGLWLAPGEVDLTRALAPLRPQLPDGAVLALRAEAVPGFPIAQSVRAAWDVESIRAAHRAFLDVWDLPEAAAAGASSPLAARTMLVADWLGLLRVDPRLPVEYLDDAWPAERSVEVFLRLRGAWAAGADAEFRALTAG